MAYGLNASSCDPLNGTGTVCTSAFCQGYGLLREGLWKEDYLLWGTSSILTPAWLAYSPIFSVGQFPVRESIYGVEV